MGTATVTILRTNGNTGAISVDYHTTNGTAVAGADFDATSGRLTIADGQISGTISVRIIDDFLIEGNETFQIVISNPTGGATISGPDSATVFIAENDFGPGSIDPTFDPGHGANSFVRALALQSDGRVLVSGAFTVFADTNRNYIARVNADGSHDLTFNPSNGPNALVSAVGVIPDGRVIIGGAFTNVNGTTYRRVARLLTNGLPDPNFNEVPNFNAAVTVLSIQADGRVLVGGGFSVPIRSLTQLRLNGSVDTSFNPGLGANAPVHAVLALPSGAAYVAGAFTQFDGLDASRVARLKPDGSFDSGFVVSAIANGTVYAIGQQSDGKVVVAGDFMLDGRTDNPHVARLNTDGSLDLSFNTNTTANGAVFAITVQPSGKIVIGGDFTAFAGQVRKRYARLNSDGSVDASFDPGNGADGTVYALLPLQDNNILLGGDFHFVNGVPRNGVAKIRANDGQSRFLGIYRNATNARMVLSVTPGANYVLETSTDLRNWTPIQTNNAANTTLEFLDPAGPGNSQRFYRARQAAF